MATGQHDECSLIGTRGWRSSLRRGFSEGESELSLKVQMRRELPSEREQHVQWLRLLSGSEKLTWLSCGAQGAGRAGRLRSITRIPVARRKS